MFTRARFIHHQTPGGKFNGFSVLLSPNMIDPTSVYVGVTFCSHSDQFCKAAARDVLLHSFEHESIRIVDLPKFLAECVAKCCGWTHVGRFDQNKWAWVYKYFL